MQEGAADGEALLGAVVLVGISHVRPDGALDRQTQFDGTVEAVGPDVIKVRRHDSGEVFELPMSPESFTPAAPGVYRLSDSGRTVTDPAFLGTWTVWPGDDSEV